MDLLIEIFEEKWKNYINYPD